MRAIIRINPTISQTAHEIVTDKFEAVKICHLSFLNVGGNKVEKIYLLDKCPQEYHDFFKQYGKVITLNSGVKKDTITEMYKYANPDDYNLFLEDDYLWRPDFNLKQLELDLDRFNVFSIYDHPLHYKEDRGWKFIDFNNNLYRNCQTVTHTFAVKGNIFKKYEYEFNFGQHDWIMWNRLLQSGLQLYSPVNSYATHLAKNCIAFNYDFLSLYNKLKSDII